MSDVELLPMDKYKQLADVNLYGVVRVTKAFAPLIRKYKGKQYISFVFVYHCVCFTIISFGDLYILNI